jgi:transcriptional regulator with XRE-family HTH domain
MSESVRNRFGESLARLRCANNYSPASFARGTGISTMSLQALENGEEGASFATIASFCKVLGVDVSEFFKSTTTG